MMKTYKVDEKCIKTLENTVTHWKADVSYKKKY